MSIGLSLVSQESELVTKTTKLQRRQFLVELSWWLEHRTPDRNAWDRCPMPQNTLRVHTECVLVKSVGPKFLWAESQVHGTGEYFPPLQSHVKTVEVEIGGVAIYSLFWEFRRASSYCHLCGAQGLGQRQAYF
ncbi:uncharacterized protein TNCV_2908821 [Trichonephila clavipes]|nr:uncharacterized protein TNCV_2908821 [Trichonephila clavipes]